MVKSSCLSVTLTASAEHPWLNHRARACNPTALELHNPCSPLLSIMGFQCRVMDPLLFLWDWGCPEGFFCHITDSLQTKVENCSSDVKIPWENKLNPSSPASFITKNQNALHSQNTQLTSSLHNNLPALIRDPNHTWFEILRAFGIFKLAKKFQFVVRGCEFLENPREAESIFPHALKNLLHLLGWSLPLNPLGWAHTWRILSQKVLRRLHKQAKSQRKVRKCDSYWILTSMRIREHT